MWFYNKFICTNVIELRNNNSIHTILNGKMCYIAYFKKGMRGIFIYESDFGEEYERLHKIVTSIVQDVTVIGEDLITVTTENTIYTFKKIEE